MKADLEAAYVGLQSKDPTALRRYLADVVGLMPGEPAGEGVDTWRVDGKAQRLFVRHGATDDAVCMGFEVPDDARFDALLERLRRHGCPIREGGADLTSARRVRRLASVHAPWGVDVEVVTGLADAPTPFASALMPRGFVTGAQGFGHGVFAVGNAADYEAARRFAIDGLGLTLSDWLRMPMGEIELNVSFFHCNPRHHSLAIACVPMPPGAQRLHHINFEVPSVPDVGAAFERALRTGTPLANTIGQHANDQMVSFYSVSPGGWRVEIGACGRVVGDDWNDVREYDRISDWGHQPPDVLVQMFGAAPTAR